MTWGFACPGLPVANNLANTVPGLRAPARLPGRHAPGRRRRRTRQCGLNGRRKTRSGVASGANAKQLSQPQPDISRVKTELLEVVNSCPHQLEAVLWAMRLSFRTGQDWCAADLSHQEVRRGPAVVRAGPQQTVDSSRECGFLVQLPEGCRLSGLAFLDVTARQDRVMVARAVSRQVTPGAALADLGLWVVRTGRTERADVMLVADLGAA